MALWGPQCRRGSGRESFRGATRSTDVRVDWGYKKDGYRGGGTQRSDLRKRMSRALSLEAQKR